LLLINSKNNFLSYLLIFIFTIFEISFIQSKSLIAQEIENYEKNVLDAKLSLDQSDSKSQLLDAYILGPGDEIDLLIYDLDKYSGRHMILNDGSISIPFVGNVKISGYSLVQAKERIRSSLESELLRPDLDLKVTKARPIKISVIGEVQKPGLYTMSTSESSEVRNDFTRIKISGLPTLVNAIQKAGGITNSSNLKEVSLKRRIPGEGYKYKHTDLNLVDLIFEGKQINNPYLMDGDIIELKKANELSPKSIEILTGNLSPSSIKINVIGEVKTPGVFNIDRNSNLNSAIMTAGGPIDNRSKKRSVELYRRNRNGTVSLSKYNLRLGIDTSDSENPILKSGDTIFVRKNLFAKTTDALDSVTKPMQGLMTGITLYKLLEQ
tara:strand:- start:1138 stop:2277 length:1140 start_codon:yes stop_codon:yes gene_type:complete